jgi:hypothetical protein
MKRIAAVTIALGALGAAVMLSGRDFAGSSADSAGTDSVWYHASDVALVGATGRSQLLEFFHPD